MAIYCSMCGMPLNGRGECACSRQEKKAVREEREREREETEGSAAEEWIKTIRARAEGAVQDRFQKDKDEWEGKKLIVPDSVKPSEGEVPIRQYKIARLFNRFLGIPFGRARGQLQVTNKRVLFRAPGKTPIGKSVLQYEFAIDELAGIESRKEYVFSLWRFILSIFLAVLGSGIAIWLFGLMTAEAARIAFGVIFGFAGCLTFFLEQRWGVKVVCFGFSMGAFGCTGVLLPLVFVVAIFTWYMIFAFSCRPNLVLIFKTKGASDAISIRRKKATVFFLHRTSDQENTGYMEILPEKDVDACVAEINALITDIQKLGDYGIKKWKVPTPSERAHGEQVKK